jgi:predicted  nucleic acid-binding Zn-ribbon protein
MRSNGMTSSLDRAKDVAEKAQAAARKAAAQARDKSQEITLKRRLSSLATELGQLVYRQREGETGLDAEVDRIISEMRGVRAELDALADSRGNVPEG